MFRLVPYAACWLELEFQQIQFFIVSPVDQTSKIITIIKYIGTVDIGIVHFCCNYIKLTIILEEKGIIILFFVHIRVF